MSALTKTDNVGQMLQDYSQSLKGYAVREYNQTAFLKSVMIAVADSEELQKTIQTEPGKRSFFNALRYASTTGLSLNPQEGKAALVAYGGKCSYQIMKNGMIELVQQTGKVEFIEADYVRENDQFRFSKKISGIDYEFTPALKDRGEVVGFFAVMKLRDGATHGKWFTVEEVEEHRKKFSSRSQMPPIGYGLKTVIKALLRSVSISTEFDTMIGSDDITEPDDTRGTTADDVNEKLTAPKKAVEPREVSGELL